MKKGYLLNTICPIWTDGTEVRPRSYGYVTLPFVAAWCAYFVGEFPLLIEKD